ncbi:hypothetical protein BKA65DRAFT_47074 [Rhexocercosporidium sp. MPI-PUGE-AT-0058]|nr:hypothetical protein BKA65DRAFT_47074 [Rhexocercosporidium sp. MPI-PUGE-AT-0058]
MEDPDRRKPLGNCQDMTLNMEEALLMGWVEVFSKGAARADPSSMLLTVLYVTKIKSGVPGAVACRFPGPCRTIWHSAVCIMMLLMMMMPLPFPFSCIFEADRRICWAALGRKARKGKSVSTNQVTYIHTYIYSFIHSLHWNNGTTGGTPAR